MKHIRKKRLPKFITEIVDPRTVAPGDRLAMTGYGVNVVRAISCDEKTFSVTILQTDGIQVISYAIGNWPEKVVRELVNGEYVDAERRI
jgi:hypothetical protein